ncbi:DUF202 domain-containing protein [Nonomuraea ferruginea]
MGDPHEIWDQGLQSERTRLAWVRTAVMLATGGLGAAGLSARAGLPLPAAAAFALAALCGAVLLIRTGTRFLRVQEALHGGLAAGPPGRRPLRLARHARPGRRGSGVRAVRALRAGCGAAGGRRTLEEREVTS